MGGMSWNYDRWESGSMSNSRKVRKMRKEGNG